MYHAVCHESKVFSGDVFDKFLSNLSKNGANVFVFHIALKALLVGEFSLASVLAEVLIIRKLFVMTL